MSNNLPKHVRPNAVEAKNLTKAYAIYPSARARVKELLSPTRTKYHKEFKALENISLEIEQGECIGIIGLNGSGKSTFLQLVAGVLAPTHGSVKTNGRIAALLELGAGFNGDFSGRENVYFQCAIMGFSRAQAKELVPKVAAFADIGDFFDQPVRTYSSGMYVRLAFAAAILVDPDILIVDEALAVGDVQFQAKCYNRIQEYRKNGKTMLFVSHDPSAVKSLCSRAILLDRGRLLADGTPDHIYNVYNALIAEKVLQEAKKNPTTETFDTALQNRLAKRSGTGEIRAQIVKIRNHLGQETDSLISGKQLTIDIEFESQILAKNPTFGISIRDRFGSEVFGVNSHMLRKDFGTIKPGTRGTVRYTMDLNLGSGLYQLSTAIHQSSSHVDSNYDWINGAVSFRVDTEGDYPFLGCARLMPDVTLHLEQDP